MPHSAPDSPPGATDVTVLDSWERRLEEWVRHLLGIYCARRQARGELFQPGFSSRAVTPEEVVRLLRPPDQDAVPTEALDAAEAARIAMWQCFRDCQRVLGRRFAWLELARLLHLADDELELLLVTYTCGMSASLQRALHFAWNDMSRRFPTAVFLWELTRPEQPERGLSRLADILTHSPLVRYHLWELTDAAPTPLFAQVALHPHVLDLIRGEESLALGAVTLVDLGLTEVVRPKAKGTPAPWHISGPEGSGRRSLAAARAESLGLRLAVVELDPEVAKGTATGLVRYLRECVRDAALKQAALHFTRFERLEDALAEAAFTELAASPIPISVASTTPPLARVAVLDRFERRSTTAPEAADRRKRLFELASRDLTAPELDDIAARYPLSDGQLTEMVRRARAKGARPVRLGRAVAFADLVHEEARRLLHAEVDMLASPVVTRQQWSDLQLPEATEQSLLGIVRYVRHRTRVFDDWNFGAKFDYGTAVTALFMGPPGTGKTMAAGLIARELGLELYRVGLNQIVSKWVGETEKNLERVFTFAEQKGVALLFDEADSLFGKRTEVSSASDRYANLETNYLLQRLENFSGVAVLTTNFGGELDSAFERRIRFRVNFEEPDEVIRERLWASLLPKTAPLSADIDLDQLARGFEMAGGHIKEAVLAAAFKAAELGGEITTALLVAAAEEQYRKMGKVFVSAKGSSVRGNHG